MVDVLEVKEIVQRAEQLLMFDMTPYMDESFAGQPLVGLPVVVTSGSQVYQPTFRITVKRKLDDAVAYAIFRKTIPPYPANSSRPGVVFTYGASRYVVSGGILYIDNEPWWWWRRTLWPPGYTYSASTPPTNWDPLGVFTAGAPAYFNGFDPFGGEVAFLITQYESWWPGGDYFGWIEFWDSGNGTVPSTAPKMVVPFTLRINRRPQTTLAV